jgi:hypothetical protein
VEVVARRAGAKAAAAAGLSARVGRPGGERPGAGEQRASSAAARGSQRLGGAGRNVASGWWRWQGRTGSGRRAAAAQVIRAALELGCVRQRGRAGAAQANSVN